MGDPRVLGFRPHRSIYLQAVVAVWRWSVELLLLAALIYVMHQAEAAFGITTPVFLLGLLAVVLAWLAHPVSRRWLVSLFWVLVTRYRLRTFFVEARIFNRSGKLPWVVTARPTAVGERCWVCLMPGLSIHNLQDAVEGLATATWARTARVERHRSRAALVRVDIVRRDPLTSGGTLPSVLIPAGASSVKTGLTAENGYGVLDLPRPVIDLRSLGVPLSTLSRPSSVKDSGTVRAGTPETPLVIGPPKSSKTPASETGSGPVSKGRGGEDVSDYV